MWKEYQAIVPSHRIIRINKKADVFFDDASGDRGEIAYHSANRENTIASAGPQSAVGVHHVGFVGFPKKSVTAAISSPTTPNVIETKLSTRSRMSLTRPSTLSLVWPSCFS